MRIISYNKTIISLLQFFNNIRRYSHKAITSLDIFQRGFLRAAIDRVRLSYTLQKIKIIQIQLKFQLLNFGGCLLNIDIPLIKFIQNFFIQPNFHLHIIFITIFVLSADKVLYYLLITRYVLWLIDQKSNDQYPHFLYLINKNP